MTDEPEAGYIVRGGNAVILCPYRCESNFRTSLHFHGVHPDGSAAGHRVSHCPTKPDDEPEGGAGYMLRPASPAEAAEIAEALTLYDRRGVIDSLPSQRVKSTRLVTAVSPRLADRIRQAADDGGVSVAEWIHTACVERLDD